MPKSMFWKCPKCGVGYSHPTDDKLCEDCGGTLVETPYTSSEVVCGNGTLSSKEIETDIMEHYVKTNPQYNPEEYEKLSKQRNEKWKRQDELLAIKNRNEREQANKPKCPTCGSTNISKIGTLERGVSVSVFGLFSSKLGKTMKCNNCGYKW